MKNLIISILLVFVGNTLWAQGDEPDINVAGIKFLDYGNNLPEDLLTVKSVVLLQIPPDSKSTSVRGDWRPMAEEAHKTFQKAGIDPVAYYYLEDAISGTEVSKAFARDLVARGVKYLITLSNVWIKIKNKDSERFVIMITAFDGTPELMTNGQVAWKTQNKKLDNALDKLLKGTTKNRLKKENLLIADYPELFRDFDIITNRRSETYSNSLNIEKAAVEGFYTADIPDNRPGGIINNNVAKEAERANADAIRNNKQFEALMGQYPYEYSIITETPDEQALLNQGYQYVVYRLHTAGASIRGILDYEIEEGVSDYITIKQSGGTTILRNLPVEAPVYKLYIKHLRTKDIYVGTKWDADETWEEALKNFVFNVKKEFKD